MKWYSGRTEDRLAREPLWHIRRKTYFLLLLAAPSRITKPKGRKWWSSQVRWRLLSLRRERNFPSSIHPSLPSFPTLSASHFPFAPTSPSFPLHRESLPSLWGNGHYAHQSLHGMLDNISIFLLLRTCVPSLSCLLMYTSRPSWCGFW